MINGFKRILKRVFLILFNFTHHTKIKSVDASIHAVYGECVAIDKGTIVESNVSIGSHSYVNKMSSVENCNIGKYCSISSGVYICPFEHDLEIVSTHPVACRTEIVKANRRPVVIGNDVLISLNAIILEGVRIGDGAVVAAGAVVTKDVEPYEIVGGVPAAHIGYRADKDKADYIRRTKWWDWSEEKIEKNIKWLQTPIKELDTDNEPD